MSRLCWEILEVSVLPSPGWIVMTTEEEARILPEEASGLELEAPSEAESLGSVPDTLPPPLTIPGLAESGKLMREPSARKMTGVPSGLLTQEKTRKGEPRKKERCPIRGLPFLPHAGTSPSGVGGSGRSQQRRSCREQFFVRRTNETVEALHQLESGHLSADPFEGDLVGTEDGWDSASIYQQELVEEYRGLHEQRTQARKMISGVEAWQRISRRKAAGYDGEDCGEAELLTTGDGLV